VIANEQRRAQQSRLLAVGQQQNHRMARRGPRRENARDLEHRRDGGAVIGGAGTRGDRVVVGGEENGIPVRELRRSPGIDAQGRDDIDRISTSAGVIAHPSAL